MTTEINIPFQRYCVVAPTTCQTLRRFNTYEDAEGWALNFAYYENITVDIYKETSLLATVFKDGEVVTI
jgi:hypothetical protein